MAGEWYPFKVRDSAKSLEPHRQTIPSLPARRISQGRFPTKAYSCFCSGATSALNEEAPTDRAELMLDEFLSPSPSPEEATLEGYVPVARACSKRPKVLVGFAGHG